MRLGVLENGQKRMINPTLLVMAAGSGTRYGGLKQIDPVGPDGETIIDYSIFDARRAGFQRIVFVIRRDIEKRFREVIGFRFEGMMEVEYVFQDLDCLRAGLSYSTNRKKPWGTAHAILVAADALHEPFGVINADDFYGRDSFRVLAKHLRSGGTSDAMVGFVLRNTLSEFGSVKRGVCQVTRDGFLRSVTEFEQIERNGPAARYTDSNGAVHRLTGDEIASMNMWGFRPTLFPHLLRQWTEFAHNQTHNDDAEFYIPDVVTTLIQRGETTCAVLQTTDSWFGVTYREDRPFVIESIRSLIKRGDYPEKLWNRRTDS
jgi:NDP-sugar pyrophosphorylase family protein